LADLYSSTLPQASCPPTNDVKTVKYSLKAAKEHNKTKKDKSKNTKAVKHKPVD